MELPLLTFVENTVRYEPGRVIMLDRRLYPEETVYRTYTDYRDVARAISDMVVQGAIVVAMTAGYGFALGLAQAEKSGEILEKRVDEAYRCLLASRKTGQRLLVILNKCRVAALDAIRSGSSAADAVVQLVNREVALTNKIAEYCGKFAAELLEDGDVIQTHCFADAALLQMARFALEAGKRIAVYCTETRPYFQGARLTASQLRDMGIRVTLVTDNMPGFLMQQGKTNKLVTAADKITLDGYVCNKIGTYGFAAVAHRHDIPFYVLGYEGPDVLSPSIAQIEIEERDPLEVFYARGTRTAVEGIEGYYPSFDITPPGLVSAIVTYKGVYPATNIKSHLTAPEPEEIRELLIVQGITGQGGKSCQL